MRAGVFLVVVAATACEGVTARPAASLLAVEPGEIASYHQTTLTIAGVNLFVRVSANLNADRVRVNQDYRGALGGEPLTSVTWVSNDTLVATSPALPEGIYDLEIEAPDGSVLGLERAVAVRDDLVATGEVEDVRSAVAAVSSSDTLVDVPLTPAVDPERSVLFFNVRHASVAPHDGHLSGQIVDGGQAVRLERFGTGVGIDVAWTVLQHSDWSVQRGAAAHSGSPTTVSLGAPVVLARSFVVATLRISGAYYNWNDWVRAELVDASTLELSSGVDNENPNAVVEWQVVSFVPTSNARVGAATADLGVGDTSAAAPVTAAPEQRSFLLFSQHSIQSYNSAASNQVRGWLDDGEVGFDRFAAGIDVEVTAYVVTWPALTTEHGSVHFAAGQLSGRVTLSRCPSHHSAAVSFLPAGMRQGRSALESGDGVGPGWFTSMLEDDDCTLVLERNDASVEADAAWTVLWVE